MQSKGSSRGVGDFGDTALDTLSTAKLVEAFYQDNESVVPAVGKVLPELTYLVDQVVDKMSQGGRLIYIGAGTSGRLGVLDASECPPTFGTAPEQVIGIIAGGARALTTAVEDVEDNEQEGYEALQRIKLSTRDTVVGLAASGRTPYVRGALRCARDCQALSALICCVKQPELERMSDVTLSCVVGEELLRGSTRLKAGTAQKLVLNLLSTCVMTRLGKVHGRWMVDMQPTNSKLRRRAAHIVSEISGVETVRAEQCLHETGYQIKPAILMASLGVDLDRAHRALAATGGNLRLALNGHR